MAQVVTIPFVAAGTKPYVVPQDCLLMAVMAGTADVSVSTDPDISPDVLEALPVDESVRTDVLCLVSSTSVNFSSPLKIPLSAGQTLFVAVNGWSFVFLLLETDLSARISVT